MFLDLGLLCNQKNIIFSIFSMIRHLNALDRKQLNATGSSAKINENFEHMRIFWLQRRHESSNIVE